MPLQDRQALRRDELIAAGVTLLGSRGGPALTVRAVCRATGLTERYFYESFTDRDEFVRAVYDDVCGRAMSTLVDRPQPPGSRRAIRRADGRRPGTRTGPAAGARSRTGAGPLGRRVDAQLHRAAAATAHPHLRSGVQAMVATGLIGALTALFTAYLNGRLTATREQFIDHCVELLLSGAAT